MDDEERQKVALRRMGVLGPLVSDLLHVVAEGASDPTREILAIAYAGDRILDTDQNTGHIRISRSGRLRVVLAQRPDYRAGVRLVEDAW